MSTLKRLRRSLGLPGGGGGGGGGGKGGDKASTGKKGGPGAGKTGGGGGGDGGEGGAGGGSGGGGVSNGAGDGEAEAATVAGEESIQASLRLLSVSAALTARVGELEGGLLSALRELRGALGAALPPAAKPGAPPSELPQPAAVEALTPVGPAIYCSPRHELPSTSINEGLKCLPGVDDAARNNCLGRHTIPFNSRYEGSQYMSKVVDVASNICQALTPGAGRFGRESGAGSQASDAPGPGRGGPAVQPAAARRAPRRRLRGGSARLRARRAAVARAGRPDGDGAALGVVRRGGGDGLQAAHLQRIPPGVHGGGAVEN